MRTNTKARAVKTYTHEGGRAADHVSINNQLRRSVLACMLFEDQFYEDGKSIADRITELAAQVQPSQLSALAVEARSKQNLRHVPLLLATVLARTGAGIPGLVSGTLEAIIQRPDELSEFLALYWRKGRTPLSAQVKKGLAAAFVKFDAYQLAKYNRDNAIKLRDVLFLCHAKPKNEEQAAVWKQLIDGTLPSPDTWEVALSAGKDKRTTFTRLLDEGALGYLALLRNLRNMQEAGVESAKINDAIMARKNGAHRVLPFRYVAAYRAAPAYARALNKALMDTVKELPRLPGHTIVLVDVSGSMAHKLSGKADLSRMDAAAALASIVPSDNVRVFSFSYKTVEVAAHEGIPGISAIIGSQAHGGTHLAEAVAAVNKLPHDRLIVITDEQAIVRPPDPVAKHAYMINVASFKNGVGYGKWTHIDGFSENVLRWMAEFENTQ